MSRWGSRWRGCSPASPSPSRRAPSTRCTWLRRQRRCRSAGRDLLLASAGWPPAVAAGRVAARARSRWCTAHGRPARRRSRRRAHVAPGADALVAGVLLALAAALSSDAARTRPAAGGLLGEFRARVRCGIADARPAAGAARKGRALWYRLFGVGGWLAHAALGGAIGRVAVSVSALAVSLAMMVAITIMVGSFRQTVIDWVGQSLQADLFVGPASRRSGARAPTISRARRGRRARPSRRGGRRRVPLRDRALREQPHLPRFRRLRRPAAIRRPPLQGSGSRSGETIQPGRAIALRARAGARTDAVIVSEPFANRYRKHAGDRLCARDTRRPRGRSPSPACTSTTRAIAAW